MATADVTTQGWLRSTGEMAHRIRAFDWAPTPMGPLALWPDALRFSLNLLLPSQAQMVLFWGPELRAFYNDAYAPTIGTKHPRALGRPASEGWAELWDDLGPMLHRVRDTGETISATDRPFQIDRAGFIEDVFFDISFSAVRGSEGDVNGVLCIVTETTGRVLANRRIAESEARIRGDAERIELALNAGAVLGTWVWDVAHDRMTGDERFARTFGLPPELLRRGMPLQEVKQSIHPQDLDRVNTLIQAAVAQGGAYRAEYRVQDTQGTWRWIEANGRAERGPDGTVVRFPGVLVDIDRRRDAEETLRMSEARFRALTQALPTQVWTANESGEITWLNERVREYTGRSMEHLLGADWLTVVHPDDAQHVLAQWGVALASGNLYETEFRIHRHDGQWRWHVVRAVPVDNQGPLAERHWVGTNTDIHDQKTVQETLAHLNETLEERVQSRTRDLLEAQEILRQSQKMEAVGQLTGGIAHDFNNLLGTISNSLQILRMRVGQGKLEGVERYIGMGEDSVRRAAALTHRLLAFSRRQTLDPKPLDTNTLVRGMEELIRRTMGPEIAVEVVGAGGLWTTKADASQLENSLLNLCINARDAMPGGGRLTIETANKWLDERTGGERELKPGQYVSLCVTDSGTGMPPDVVERIFDPFYTTKPIGMGTGLGLSMVYGFVRQSGGQVRVYSEVGKGTTMCLYLPRYLGEQGVEHPPAPAQAMVPGEGETVVVIEDEWGIRMTIEEILRDAGYHVLTAENGPAGMRILNSDVRVDLLITDVGLPGGMNGRQVADAARTQRPALKVLFITGYADNAAVGNGHLEPGMAVLTKPFEIAALSSRVRAMVEQG
jgi:PAS domain S-box-containing protein